MKKHILIYYTLFLTIWIMGFKSGTENPLKVTVQKNITEKEQTINITVSGGQSPYSIKCYGPGFKRKTFQKANFTLNNPEQGKYLVVVKDQNNNLTKKTFHIKEE